MEKERAKSKKIYNSIPVCAQPKVYVQNARRAEQPAESLRGLHTKYFIIDLLHMITMKSISSVPISNSASRLHALFLLLFRFRPCVLLFLIRSKQLYKEERDCFNIEMFYGPRVHNGASPFSLAARGSLAALPRAQIFMCVDLVFIQSISHLYLPQHLCIT